MTTNWAAWTTEDLISQLLEREAPNISEEAFRRTPARYVDAFRELMGDKDEVWEFTCFDSACDEMVIVRDISFVSLCEHHILPFIGKAHVAYVPQGKIAGLSKFARAVQTLSRGLWTQELLTIQIADFLEQRLQPLGVGVIMEAEHTCMAIRGVKAVSARTTTSSMRGVFRDNANNARAEFLALVK